MKWIGLDDSLIMIAAVFALIEAITPMMGRFSNYLKFESSSRNSSYTVWIGEALHRAETRVDRAIHQDHSRILTVIQCFGHVHQAFPPVVLPATITKQ